MEDEGEKGCPWALSKVSGVTSKGWGCMTLNDVIGVRGEGENVAFLYDRHSYPLRRWGLSRTFGAGSLFLALTAFAPLLAPLFLCLYSNDYTSLAPLDRL